MEQPARGRGVPAPAASHALCTLSRKRAELAGAAEHGRMAVSMFEGFALETIDLPEVSLRVRHGGSGPPVLLLHGHPRTHATWHRVAPLLATSHTVVCPDLRGYGRSSGP